MEYFDVFNNEENSLEQQFTNITISQSENICIHANTTIDNSIVICVDCGVQIEKIQTYEKEWRYYDNESKSNPTRCVARKTTNMVILKDLENMGLGENVIRIANDIYVQVTKGKIKRGKSSRKAIIAACLFHAYKKLGTPKSCDMLREIMKDINLEKSDFLHGIKQVALNTSKSENIHNSYITPIDIINEIMNLLNASQSQKDEVINFYNEIHTLSPIFKESRPQSVAAGFVFNYICINSSIKMTIKEFAVKVKTSELTINKIRNEIKKISK